MVNWFRKGADGNFIWPGYGENLRVLKWMLDRIHGRAGGRETPVGIVPNEADLDLKGLDLAPKAVREKRSQCVPRNGPRSSNRRRSFSKRSVRRCRKN